jgi:DNA uptake protein ComE-like DNA-binding protein
MIEHDPDRWFSQTPQWVYFCCVPFIGGFGLTAGGARISNPWWMLGGVAFVLISFGILYTRLSDAWLVIFIGQVAIAFFLKSEYLVRTFPSTAPLPSDPKLAQRVLALRPKIDINTCSKDDLVRGLSLPIVYVNDIFALRASGHIFTHLEELTEMVGIPQETLQRIGSAITFSYNPRQESYVSWRRANSFSVEELMAVGLKEEVARAIVEGRARGGQYRSVVDISQRTGLPIEAFRALL